MLKTLILSACTMMLLPLASSAADNRVFGLIRKVRGIKIGEVIIFDAVIGGATGQVVEHRLVDRARKQKPIRKAEMACHSKHPHEGRRRADDGAPGLDQKIDA